MRKQWLGICIAAGLLAACSSEDVQQKTVSTPQPAVCNGPTVEISGADPQYETPNATANQDYERDGKSYKIVQDPSNFTQAGFAAIYDAEPNSNLTASGEAFDPTQLTAAHPTLPIPSYARITNLANGRMIVVRINDRGPYGNDRVISLSRASADRLNTSNNTKVRIDPIVVAPDGSLSGPGTVQGSVAPAVAATAAVAPAAAASASGDFVVQVGAVSDQARAQQYQQRLSQQFSVPGRVTQNGAVWRIQLGPFSSKAQASTIQQRLQSEAQLQSFITRAN